MVVRLQVRRRCDMSVVELDVVVRPTKSKRGSAKWRDSAVDLSRRLRRSSQSFIKLVKLGFQIKNGVLIFDTSGDGNLSSVLDCRPPLAFERWKEKR